MAASVGYVDLAGELVGIVVVDCDEFEVVIVVVPYYQSPMLRIVADKADCVTSPGQGKPHRIIWNEQ
jgi:hypothetical protein